MFGEWDSLVKNAAQPSTHHRFPLNRMLGPGLVQPFHSLPIPPLFIPLYARLAKLGDLAVRDRRSRYSERFDINEMRPLLVVERERSIGSRSEHVDSARNLNVAGQWPAAHVNVALSARRWCPAAR